MGKGKGKGTARVVVMATEGVEWEVEVGVGDLPLGGSGEGLVSPFAGPIRERGAGCPQSPRSFRFILT